MNVRIDEVAIKERAPAYVDRNRADLFDEFYAQQDAENQALLDTWVAALVAGREKFGIGSAKSLLASMIVFVHERPAWVPKEQR